MVGIFDTNTKITATSTRLSTRRRILHDVMRRRSGISVYNMDQEIPGIHQQVYWPS